MNSGLCCSIKCFFYVTDVYVHLFLWDFPTKFDCKRTVNFYQSSILRLDV